ncbi:MAG: Crp/Fnr family transcriptional regulator [bacterium]|jgi:CRP/FNR family transcriptional regulator|nr:Crp/Fnr family transcriptional regulator [bacterium]
MDISSVINDNQILGQLTDDEKSLLAKVAKVRVYPRNTFIFWQNENVLNGYLLDKGLIKLYRSHQNGRTRTLSLKTDNDLISELSLLFPFKHLCTAQVLNKSSVICFPVEELTNIAGENSNFQKSIRQVVNVLIERSLMEIENRIFMNINGCLATKLIQLTNKFGVTKEGGTMINLKLSQQQLADMIGTNRETVCKALLMFKKCKAIGIKNKLITILNKSKLEAWQ